MSLGAAMAGGNPKEGRVANEFYATPSEAVIALIEEEKFFIPKKLNEPCVGNGAIADVLTSYGYKVSCADILDYGYPNTEIQNFLETHRQKGGIITNPPFNIAEKFIRHALNELNVEYLAVLLKATFFSAACRQSLFEDNKPTIIYPLTWRLDFNGLGRPVMETAWYVWRNSKVVRTEYKLLSKPKEIKND